MHLLGHHLRTVLVRHGSQQVLQPHGSHGSQHFFLHLLRRSISDGPHGTSSQTQWPRSTHLCVTVVTCLQVQTGFMTVRCSHVGTILQTVFSTCLHSGTIL